jgi:hypothetical protein
MPSASFPLPSRPAAIVSSFTAIEKLAEAMKVKYYQLFP